MRSAMASMIRSQLQVLFVVGLLDQGCVFGHAQGCGFEFFQTLYRLGDDAVFSPLFSRQIKQNHRNFDVDQVRSNLRTHHACA
jgi:hypothetical protein